ncbi:glycoside hydrolase family 3 C-terminal domain-containing protein [Henriciella sp. AS95]|uniref:beta-glucosidase family protein n=1 Tax=Henriciella sp. AS95 TaxID=3135782 RepID=UPI0031750478
MRRTNNRKAWNVVAVAAITGLLASCATAPNDAEVDVSDAAPQTASSDDQIMETLSTLTVGDKLKLLTGQGYSRNGERLPETDRFVPGAAGYTYAIDDQGISSLVLADGPAGLRLAPVNPETGEPQYVTAFPIATLIASSWDTDLASSVGEAMGAEAAAFGVDFLLGPGMNLHRNPLAGRNFEYYSEDPLLNGRMAGAAVRGIQSKGVGATIKHFIANNQETNRFVVDTLIGQRALRELYLRGFEIAIEDGEPWAIMTSYNKLNGTHTSQSRELLTDILRNELGFDGVIMSDWFSGDDAPQQIRAGNNLIMPGSAEQDEALKRAYEDGSLSEATIDANVGWILAAIEQVRDAAKPAPDKQPPLEQNAALARRAAAESTVLLKNDTGALPLSPSIETIALFGTGAYATVSGGTGSGDVNEAYTIHVADGLSEHGWTLDDTLASQYRAFIADFEANKPKPKDLLEQFLLHVRPGEMTFSEENVAAAAHANDAAIMTISRNAGEFTDREVDGDFDLTAEEKALLTSVSEAFRAEGKPVIVVLNIGNVIETASWRDLADAIILPWQGGQEAGRAVADVLSGDVNPSGKLPMTFPLSYADTPSAPYFPGTEDRSKPIEIMGGLMEQYESEAAYEEGIYVGYRYFTSADKAVAYPFGYGLSYTTFTFDNLEAERPSAGAPVSVSLSATNTGETAGRTVAQIYVEAPDGKLHKPRRELKAFAKTPSLAPGETARLEMQITMKDLASFDPETSQWIVEAGQYRLQANTSANDVGVETVIEIPETLIVDTVSAQLAPSRAIGDAFEAGVR